MSSGGISVTFDEEVMEDFGSGIFGLCLRPADRAQGPAGWSVVRCMYFVGNIEREGGEAGKVS